MAYDSGKLSLVRQAIVGPKEWAYDDTGGEAAATYNGAGYFTNAKTLGVSVGDELKVYNRATDVVYRGSFTAVQDTGGTTGTAQLDTGSNYP